MGLIDMGLGLIFGGGRNVLRETAEVFRANSEAQAQRDHQMQGAALGQFGAEFRDERSGFDRFMDGLNRLPRPAMAFGALGLFVSAMVDPVWFSQRMQGLALVPEALWWLLGAVVSFYFGARYQVKNQEFQRQVSGALARTPVVVENIRTLGHLGTPSEAPETPDTLTQAPDALAVQQDANPALSAWRNER